MSDVPANRRAKKFAIRIGADALRQVSAMLGRQNVTGMTSNQRDVSFGAIGCLGGTALPPQGNICFFTGAPINGPDVREISDVDAAKRFFPSWDGAFTGVFWDAQQNVLVIATDCLGMQPLYMRYTDGELTLVSETKALMGEPDLAAWGAFISIGHPIGDRSLMKGLRRVPPASILTYDCSRRQLSIRRYWEWPEPSSVWRHYDFLGSLEQDIRGYATPDEAGTLLLSGGFDSRLLLFLLQRARIPTDALIVAHADQHHDADGRFAEAVAAVAGVRYRKAHPPADFFSSAAYLDYLRASDVGYPSLDLFIAQVASQIDGAAVWDGLVPGFVFMPLHQPDGGFAAYLQQEIRGRDNVVWRAATAMFKPEAVDAMWEGFSHDLRTEVSRMPQDMYGLARFVIENRSRNRASMNPLKVYANWTNAFTPGLSKDFMTHSATIPFGEKRHARFYRSLFARLDKRALAIPFVSGDKLMKGRRIGAFYLGERAHAMLDQFHSRYPSLFPGTRPHAPGYSRFLGPRLIAEEDEWLDPSVGEQFKTVNKDNYLAWKLLFHWKAWQWIHDGSLDQMLDG